MTRNASAPVPRPDDARVRRSRSELRVALLRLLVRTPFDDLTIREIADAAGVGYTTFFRHYPDKDALLHDLVTDEIAHLTSHALPLYDAADLPGACLALCRYVDEHRDLWRGLLTGGASAIVRAELLRQSLVAVATRIGPQLLPVELTISLAVAGMFELLSWWMREPAPCSVEMLADILDGKVLAPLLARPPD